ncbi:hypothetical protein [Erythrobacter sp.]|uniref:hypothetical protein n=1 Tax=Erythrobacter sp. TaxID=1042 RepID=UPI0025CE831F|nr:hypothetical protein [Erythrobacter sp.]
MSLRISSALVFLPLLAACAEESPPPPGVTVECAIGAGADLSPVCTLELVAGSPDMVIHHPDGGFRRFARDAATGALAPLDGAEPLVPLAGEGGAVQFSVGEDRYHISPEMLTTVP